MGLGQQARIRSRRRSGRVHDHDGSDGAPTDPTHDTSGSANLGVRPTPEPRAHPHRTSRAASSLANLKDVELANLPTTSLAEVADATEQGIQRICKSDRLVVGFLAHTGLSLDPMNRQPNPTHETQNNVCPHSAGRHPAGKLLTSHVTDNRTLTCPSTAELGRGDSGEARAGYGRDRPGGPAVMGHEGRSRRHGVPRVRSACQ
jgi:hypothetical protein